ncbi:cell wall hydrolase [Priestia aryabhattai]
MFRKFVLPSAMALSLLVPSGAFASTYTAKKGDTLKSIATTHNISLSNLVSYNPQIKNPDSINIGEEVNLSSPSKKDPISDSDKELMARLVHAEANGESYAGKVAVATVILNRLDNANFPDTIPGVIYETYENGKIYAFEPVQNGTIKEYADKDSIRAVDEAVRDRGKGKGSLFFYNKETSTSKWIAENRTVTITIGNHTFAK